jgi:hypothetical protein
LNKSNIKVFSMKFSVFILVIFSSVFASGQNVGVGTTTPAERLDVNGNINVTGTIKANGVDGNPNQVLMKNGSGALSWGDLCDYKNYAIFREVGNLSWIVPAGVTEIVVEVWGPGGGGSQYCSGAGGGYARGVYSVVPTQTITMDIPAGGVGGATPQNGSVTSVSIGPNGIFAFGGFRGGTNINFIDIARGGGADVAGNFRNFIYAVGESGQISTPKFIGNGTTNYETTEGGQGGNGANTTDTGGKPGYRLNQLPAGTNLRNATPEPGKQPGGGGGAGFDMISAGSVNGAAGGPGMVVIRY